MKRIVLGILAHVDAGKTTLSESLLYESGVLRELGRVDKKNTMLDNFEDERARGITIFSKQANLTWGDTEIILLDTPGHVDFATEMERTLQVLDYCVLVISGADGVQGHTRTLWKLLSQYQIPTLIFVNKMDQPGTDENKLLSELQQQLSSGILTLKGEDYLQEEEVCENIAMCDETLMEQYLEGNAITHQNVVELVEERKLFPCFFGSALKLDGVKELLDGLDRLTTMDECSSGMAAKDKNVSENKEKLADASFGAKVYKISRDTQGNRLTHLKVTQGSMNVRMLVSQNVNSVEMLAVDSDSDSDSDVNSDVNPNVNSSSKDSNETVEEKITQIRVYQGEKYETVEIAEKGMVCAVLGLTKTYPGQGLGVEDHSPNPVLQPVMTFQMNFPRDVDAKMMYPKIAVLGEEDPALHILWNEKTRGIEVKLMGEVQTEILRSIIKNRFDVDVTFGEGRISYRETIKNVVEGVGHFEPLRHYAEVHLLLEPGEPGSGLTFDADVSEDVLSRNWQRLILTHLGEKEHRGVLTGSPITDMKITIINGRAHQKHTEGGDFRKATYRAVRHGLMKAESELLEPYYQFQLEIPMESLGKALSDLDRMKAKFEAPEMDGEVAHITGIAPVSLMNGYQKELVAYTKGRGNVTFQFFGYRPCHNTEEVLARIGYDPTTDVRNPVSSVFCAHGAGFVVDWMDVESYMHLENGGWRNNKLADEELLSKPIEPMMMSKQADIHERYRDISYSDDQDLQNIFKRTYGESKKPRTIEAVTYEATEPKVVYDNKWVKPSERMKLGMPGQDSSGANGKGSGSNNGKNPGKNVTKSGVSPRKEYLLVDGYNVIHANPELEELMKINLESARNALMDILCNYQGFRKQQTILVFDAYRVKGNQGEIIKYNNIDVVYTKEAETADRYIERTAHEISHDYNTTVVTSDGLEQVIIRGAGCRLMSSREFWEDVALCDTQIAEIIYRKRRE